MKFEEALERAHDVLAISRVPLDERPPIRSFLQYSYLVCLAAKGLTAKDRDTLPWLADWATTWRRLSDDFSKIVEADPLILYEPPHQTALEFHSSKAYIRYFRSGNRTGKTTSGLAEGALIATGRHRWRNFGRPPHTILLIAGLPFKHYLPAVFEPKMLVGETDNPLSPMFPVGGKWFNHYDERRHELTLACEDCAEGGKAGTCQHPKSTYRVVSSETGREDIQGAVYTLVHFDEDSPEEFYWEARQRTKTAKYGCLILTGTPLSGQLAWEQTKVASRVMSADNLMEDGNPEVSLHEVNQFDAGLVPHDRIRLDVRSMDKFEVDARIYGKPVNIANNPVFEREVLEEFITKFATRPVRGNVLPKAVDGIIPPYVTLSENSEMEFFEAGAGSLRVWKRPQSGEVYVAGVDTAAGLTGGDWSCASIVRVFQSGGSLSLDLVAQYHSRINPTDYADALFPILIWYNSALCAVELTGGLGRAVVTRLKNEHAYWNMYREQVDPTLIDFRLDARVGVETSTTSKPFMVAALQRFIKDRRIVIPCADTVLELSAFEQETKNRAGMALTSPKFRGAKSSPDDRVMSLAIVAGVAVTHQPLLFAVQYGVETKNKVQVSKDMATVHNELAKERSETLLNSGMI